MQDTKSILDKKRFILKIELFCFKLDWDKKIEAGTEKGT